MCKGDVNHHEPKNSKNHFLGRVYRTNWLPLQTYNQFVLSTRPRKWFLLFFGSWWFTSPRFSLLHIVINWKVFTLIHEYSRLLFWTPLLEAAASVSLFVSDEIPNVNLLTLDLGLPIPAAHTAQSLKSFFALIWRRPSTVTVRVM